MAHSPIREQLIALASSTSGDPMNFLDGLSDIHDNWHQEVVRTYGFLLFHHRVVRYFNTIVNSQLQPTITAYTRQEFEGMGVAPFGGNLANIDTLPELRNFASSVEAWHNAAHDRIARATGTPLLDARQNIYFRAFWRLHLYIENLFMTVLQQYGDRAHPNEFLSLQAVAEHIEAAHHAWVPNI